MATVRVTQGLIIQRSLVNLRDQTRRLLQTQEQLSTGRSVVNLSDDPLGARVGIAARTLLARNDQFASNINVSSAPLRETGTNIQQTVDILQRVRELTLQAANGTNGQQQLDAIAEEVNVLLEQVFTIGNHQTNNRYIFAGTRTTQAAFTATRGANDEITAVTYEGNDEDITISAGETTRVVINEPGSEVFDGSVDIFQMIIDIRDDMRAGNYSNLSNARLAEMDDAEEQLLSAIARVGSVDRRFERITTGIDDVNIELERVRSEALDADFAEVIIDLNAQSNAYTAALNASSRVIQPSLLDFLR